MKKVIKQIIGWLIIFLVVWGFLFVISDFNFLMSFIGTFGTAIIFGLLCFAAHLIMD
jgi:hypothetical protein